MTYRLTPSAVQGEEGKFTYPGELKWTSWNGPFGGALLGSMIEGMEQRAGQQLVAVTAQFLKTARHGQALTFVTEILAAGRAVAQARASGVQDGVLLFTASAVLASSPEGLEVGSASRMPIVLPPESSPARTFMRPIKGGLNDTLDVRIAGMESPRVRLWARCPAAAGNPLTASLLAAYADHPPYGVGLMRGGDWYGITLDSSLRIVSSPASLDGASWVLVDIVFDAMGDQFGFATVNLWTPDGLLLAIGTQTLRLRNGIAKGKG